MSSTSSERSSSRYQGVLQLTLSPLSTYIYVMTCAPAPLTTYIYVLGVRRVCTDASTSVGPGTVPQWAEGPDRRVRSVCGQSAQQNSREHRV